MFVEVEGGIVGAGEHDRVEFVEPGEQLHEGLRVDVTALRFRHGPCRRGLRGLEQAARVTQRRLGLLPVLLADGLVELGILEGC
ncbi:MAG TPA: hypothetical protein VIW24_10110 [Aldersonia sp.]